MPMIMRLVIYEGTERQLAEQLGRSLSEGVRKGNLNTPTITITRIPEAIQLLLTEATVGVAEAVARVMTQEVKAFYQKTMDSQDPHEDVQ